MLLPILLQLAGLLVVMQAIVWCLPTAYRAASRTNCYRLDGSRSPNRAYREQRAYNRLRLQLLVPLSVVFLTGNAVYQTIDKSIVPIAQLTTAGGGPLVRVMGLCGLWLVASLILVGWYTFTAFRNFAEGVRARSTEHYHLDMTRQTTTAASSPKVNTTDVA